MQQASGLGYSNAQNWVNKWNDEAQRAVAAQRQSEAEKANYSSGYSSGQSSSYHSSSLSKPSYNSSSSYSSLSSSSSSSNSNFGRDIQKIGDQGVKQTNSYLDKVIQNMRYK